MKLVLHQKQIMRNKLSLWLVILAIIFSPAILLAQSVPTNQLVIPPKTYSVSFRWKGDSIRFKQGGSKWEAHAAILLPVKLNNCPRTFYMQFDLGSPYSLLYQNKIDAIQSKYPESIPPTAEGKLKDFSFQTGEIPILANEIVVKQFDSVTIDWKNKNAIEIIGTIGADLIDGKVAIIDYPKAKLTISPQIPEKLVSKLALSDLIYSSRRVLFPAKVNGKTTMLYFDTGSSMFELLTNKETANQLALPDAKAVQYDVESWGKTLTANTLASNGFIEMADVKIPLRSATYIDGVSPAQVEQMLKMGIGGMTGNKLLLNYILVLDTKNKKFGLCYP